MTSIQEVLLVVKEMAEVLPQVLDMIDEDKVVKKIADIKGIDPDLLRSDEQVQFIRQLRQEMQQRQMQMQALQAGGGIAKDVSQAQKNFTEGSRN